MGRSSLEGMCFFFAVVQRGSFLAVRLHISCEGHLRPSMTGSHRDFAAADMLTVRTPLDSIPAAPSFAGVGHAREVHLG
jgi:hypothetical protein